MIASFATNRQCRTNLTELAIDNVGLLEQTPLANVIVNEYRRFSRLAWEIFPLLGLCNPCFYSSLATVVNGTRPLGLVVNLQRGRALWIREMTHGARS